MKNIHCAVLTVGGWFDAEDLQGPFTTFHSIDKNNSGIFNALVVGPWVHGGWARYDGEHLGRVDFASNTGEYYRKNILFPFFEQYLKGNGDAKLPKAYVFETGTNVWRQYSAWPPKNAEPKTLYFHANGGLSFEAPAAESPSFDEYVSDPAKPVPFVNYAALNVPQEYMLSDQRFADSRTDVVVYESASAAGRCDHRRADLAAAFRFDEWHGFRLGREADRRISARLSGQQAGRAPARRPRQAQKRCACARIHDGLDISNWCAANPSVENSVTASKSQKPFTPGKVEEVNFTMQDINHTFRRGHRIMVQVQSSWFPLTDRNPQTFVNIPDAKPADFVKATERVYHTNAEPSGIMVQVVPRPVMENASK